MTKSKARAIPMEPRRRESPLTWLPAEHLAAHPELKQSLLRRRPIHWVIMAVPCTIGVWCAMKNGKIAGPLILSVVPATIGFGLWFQLITGFVSTNLGQFTRDTQPVRYWITVVIMALVYLACIAAAIRL